MENKILEIIGNLFKTIKDVNLKKHCDKVINTEEIELATLLSNALIDFKKQLMINHKYEILAQLRDLSKNYGIVIDIDKNELIDLSYQTTLNI